MTSGVAIALGLAAGAAVTYYVVIKRQAAQPAPGSPGGHRPHPPTMDEVETEEEFWRGELFGDSMFLSAESIAVGEPAPAPRRRKGGCGCGGGE